MMCESKMNIKTMHDQVLINNVYKFNRTVSPTVAYCGKLRQLCVLLMTSVRLICSVSLSHIFAFFAVLQLVIAIPQNA